MQSTIAYSGEMFDDLASFIREKPKEQIRRELDRETSLYIVRLQELEARCNRPRSNRDALQREINEVTNRILEVCARAERQITDASALKAAQIEFRERTNDILSKSYCINRTRNWPLGHQGDYYTLELAYKNAPLSGGVGYYLDRYMLSAPLADGVRERIVMLRELLRSELSVRQNAQFLDIACGSCREVFEVAPLIRETASKFVCVDLDENALHFALDRFEHAGLTEEHVELRKYNALRIFDFETALAEFGLQDVIYSVGYFDYLPDDFLAKLLNSLYQLLAPGGKLIAAFKDANRYNPCIYHWLVNWDGFLTRTEEDFKKIFQSAGIPDTALSMSRVDSGSIIFYSVEKQ